MTPRTAPPAPLTDQMRSLRSMAVEIGMDEAVHWLETHFPWEKGKGHCCPPKIAIGKERVQTILADTWDENGQLR